MAENVRHAAAQEKAQKSEMKVQKKITKEERAQAREQMKQQKAELKAAAKEAAKLAKAEAKAASKKGCKASKEREQPQAPSPDLEKKPSTTSGSGSDHSDVWATAVPGLSLFTILRARSPK